MTEKASIPVYVKLKKAKKYAENEKRYLREFIFLIMALSFLKLRKN